MNTMPKTSFGKYFDDQRDRIVKNMQNKNKQQNVEWMEAYEKREQLKDYNHRRSIQMPVDSTQSEHDKMDIHYRNSDSNDKS